MKRAKNKINITSSITFLILLLYTIIMAALLLWAIFTALKDRLGFFLDPVGIPNGLPWEWSWSNFAVVFSNFYVTIKGGVKVDIWEMLLNTMLYAGMCSIISSFVPCVMGYVTAKYKYRFNAVLNTFVIFAMSFKVVGAYPAEVAVLKQLGLYDQIYGAWIQKIAFIGIYYFIYQAAFYNIPNDYLDSARIDGASEYMVMFRVMIPLVKNVFFTIVLLNFIGYWNDYQAPYLYIPSWPILTFGLHWLEQNNAQEMSNEPARIAGCIIVAIPILIIFLAFKSRIMGSITFGGIKE